MRSAFSAVDWHVHEMLYGYLPAVVTGLLLTASFVNSAAYKVYPRPAICLRLDISNTVHVDVDLLIFDIRQPFPRCHVEPPKLVRPHSSLQLDVGSKLGGFVPRQIHIGHARMRCQKKISNGRLIEIGSVRYGRKRWSLRGPLLLTSRYDVAVNTPALSQ